MSLRSPVVNEVEYCGLFPITIFGGFHVYYLSHSPLLFSQKFLSLTIPYIVDYLIPRLPLWVSLVTRQPNYNNYTYWNCITRATVVDRVLTSIAFLFFFSYFGSGGEGWGVSQITKIAQYFPAGLSRLRHRTQKRSVRILVSLVSFMICFPVLT